jgi:hypothetical protein
MSPATRWAAEIRADVNPKELLSAVASLCLPVPDAGIDYSRRMVALLVDGLRYGAGAGGSGSSGRRSDAPAGSPSVQAASSSSGNAVIQ